MNVGLKRKLRLFGQSIQTTQDLYPSNGEVYFLWSFIQGSIMIPETRWQLRHAWGMCERHGFLAVAVEGAFRHCFFHGPAIVYGELMERALAAFNVIRPFEEIQIVRHLREIQPCLMCELEYGPHTHREYLPDYIRAGKDLSQIRAFAQETAPYWRALVCGRCAGTDAQPRCRIHLRQDLANGSTRIAEKRAQVEYITEHIATYRQSFVWEYRDSETLENRAALISAIGWCSGWRPWLVLMNLVPNRTG
ncbi:hypothetical protein ANRL1_01090 [Anaerolineae bacterium]|nr:hypothetical protein ANRL1_01090 [Anaerolineae bacterium]